MTKLTFQNPRIVAAIAALGLGSVMYDNTAITTAMPSIQNSLMTETSALQWILSVMSITTGTVLPFAGAFGDRYGPLKAFRVGLFIFGLGALCASQSPTFAWLLAARIVQGIGVAFMLPNGGAILSANVEPRYRNKAVGLWISFSSIGLLIGPLAGGYLTQNYGWHSVLWGHPIISFFGLALTFFLKEGEKSVNLNTLDIRGILSISGATLLFSAGVIDAGRSQPHPLMDFTLIISGITLYLIFYRIECKVQNPLIEISWFRSKRVRGVLIACFIYNATIPAATFLVSLLAQKSKGFSPLLGGGVILAMCILMPFGARKIGQVKNSHELRRLMLWAIMGLMINYLLIGIFARASIPIFFLTLFGAGLFAGVLFAGDTIAIMDSLEPEKTASGLAALSMVRQIAAVIGIALFGTLAEVSTKISGSSFQGHILGIGASGLVTIVAWFILRSALSPVRSD